MFEFHGWSNLNYHSHDIDDELQREAIEKFISYIKEMKIDDFCTIQSYNGMDSFMISRMHNHRQEYIIDVFKWIAVNLPGSYGLLYIHDDEDFYGSYKKIHNYDDPKIDNSNKFIVYKLAKGILSREEDPFLSPYVPIIEDEYDPTRDR